MIMNVELAQTIALIAYGNEYLSSLSGKSRELFPSHSTFQYVSDVSFRRGKELDDAVGKPEILANDVRGWFSHLETDGIKNLQLDLLNLQHLPSPYTTSLLTAGGAWVIQTDQGKCWQPGWSLMHPGSRQARPWKVEYWERENTPVIRDFPDIETAYQDLENALVGTQNFSQRFKFGWEKWFGKALHLLHDPSPVLPFYADLLPPMVRTIKVRQLLAGALQAWVFGELGSWNDVYIIDSSLEKEYQQLSKNLYVAVIQSVGAVTNSTIDDRLSQLSIP